MNERIRADIDVMFKELPKTRKALELKEEIIANAQDKLADLLEKGYREEDAYEVVIHSIGNVKELSQELETDEGENQEEWQSYSRKRAKINAAAIGLYIFALAMFMLFAMLGEANIQIGELDMSTLGLVVGMIICIFPTAMLIYTYQTAPRYFKKEDTMVEEYREWKQVGQGEKEVRKAISNIIWSMAVVIYLLISITFGYWHITWVIFIVAGCIESIVRLVFSLKRG